MFILWLKDGMSAINQPGQTEQRCCFLSVVITHSDVPRDGRQCHPQAALVNLSCCGSRKGGEKKKRGEKKNTCAKPFTSERGDSALTREMRLGNWGGRRAHGALAESRRTKSAGPPGGQDNRYERWTNAPPSTCARVTGSVGVLRL